MRLIKYPFLTIAALFFVSASTAGCATSPSNDQIVEATDTVKAKTETMAVAKSEPHQYGGWYCPDNLGMFPPVNVEDYKTVPVVADRLPTREETRNGSSLMFIDPNEYPDAKPLSMDLPRLARYFNESTDKTELVIVIQAVTVQGDSVVGFRYLNGGNGSAWIHEVEFMEDAEAASVPSTPFYYRELEFGGTTSALWNVITGTEHSKTLGAFFAEGAYVTSDWRRGSDVHVFIGDQEVMTGKVTAAWNKTYLQLDYKIGDMNYVEKYFMMEQENGAVHFVVASGPFGQDSEGMIQAWDNWFNKVVEIAKKKSADDC